MGCSPSGADCSSMGPPWGHKSCQQTCSSVGSSTGCRWISAPPWISMGCRGNLSAPAPGAPPLLPSSLTLVSAELFLSHLLTPLCHCNCYSPETSFPFLKYVILEVLPLWLMGSALASSGSVLEPTGIDFIGHGGSFQQLLTEAMPMPPHRYQNLATQTQYICEAQSIS